MTLHNTTGVLLALLLFSQTVVAETPGGMTKAERDGWAVYSECLYKVSVYFARISKEPAETVLKASRGTCSDSRDAVEETTRALRGKRFTDDLMVDIDKHLGEQMLLAIIGARAKDPF